MASSSPLLFLFLSSMLIFSSLPIEAREGVFFSKMSRTEPGQKPAAALDTEIAAIAPATPPAAAPLPEFTRISNSYGLYGKNTENKETEDDEDDEDDDVNEFVAEELNQSDPGMTSTTKYYRQNNNADNKINERNNDLFGNRFDQSQKTRPQTVTSWFSGGLFGKGGKFSTNNEFSRDTQGVNRADEFRTVSTYQDNTVNNNRNRNRNNYNEFYTPNGYEAASKSTSGNHPMSYDSYDFNGQQRKGVQAQQRNVYDSMEQYDKEMGNLDVNNFMP